MLAVIKKLLMLLGGLCVIVVVLEELSDKVPTIDRGPHLGYWTSALEPNSHFNVSSLQQTIDGGSHLVTDRPGDISQPPADERDTMATRTEIPDISVLQEATNFGGLLHNKDELKKNDWPSPLTAIDQQLDGDAGQKLDDDDDDDEERRLRLSPFIYHEDEERERRSIPPRQTTVKLVSYYLPWDLARHSLGRFDGCRYKKCRYVNNMSQADAVLFRASHIRDHIIPNFYRPEGQRWIFFTSDPAVKQFALDRPDVRSQFNATMTYKLDSDIPILFGRLRRWRSPPSRDYEAIFNRKNKYVAWFVSHCPTWGQRELYVRRMSTIVHVDVFGKCGNLTCGPVHYRGNDSTECLPMLSDHYKFYLAFENSFCKDYISEKFFKLFQNVDVIPVVRGGLDYKRYLPSGIFVDASDFKTPEDLAHYLIQLGNNKTEYIAMLKRKRQWIEVETPSIQCRVCQALHTAQLQPKYYPNLKVTFNGDPSDCWRPRDLDRENIIL